MINKRYDIGAGRRFVAGNMWCADKANQGKLPCLKCRGVGTIHGKKGKIKCRQCDLTGHEDVVLWKIWFKLWVYTQVTGRTIDETLFYG